MKRIDQYLATGAEMTLVYFYRRYGDGMYMAILYGADNAARMMDHGESQEHYPAMDYISGLEIVPLVSGSNFSDCLERMEKLLELSAADNFKEMDDIYYNVRCLLDLKYPYLDMKSDLAKRCEAYKAKIGQTQAAVLVNCAQT